MSYSIVRERLEKLIILGPNKTNLMISVSKKEPTWATVSQLFHIHSFRYPVMKLGYDMFRNFKGDKVVFISFSKNFAILKKKRNQIITKII